MTYEASIFAELADNGHLGCMSVVVVNAQKWGCFEGCFVRGPVRFWLAGGSGPESSDKSVPCPAHKQTGPIPKQSI